MTSKFISLSASLISCVAAVACGSKQPTGSIDPPVLVSSDEQPSAGDGVDFAFIHARVTTLDPAKPKAQAIAIDDGKVVAVGTDAEIEGLIGAGTQVFDRPVTITPGLIDAHCHLYGLGTSLDMISLRDLTSEAAVLDAVKAGASRFPPGTWIVGRGWDQTRWASNAWPTKALLDAAFPTQPVLLRRVDGHVGWANSAALAAAKITRTTKNPVGGRFLRDQVGEPTGIIIDNALAMLDAVVPPPTAADLERRILAGATVAVAAGLTGVHEMMIEDDVAAAYTRLAQTNQLPLNVYAFLDGQTLQPSPRARLSKGPEAPTGRFQMRGVKFFADGALGSRGARLKKPYDDDKKSVGTWLTPPDELKKRIRIASGFGWQVAVHAIGDAAVATVLDAYADVIAQQPGDLRNRIEHAQVIDPADLRAFQETQTIASMQPTHATSDMRWAVQRVGTRRIIGAYAWRTVLEKRIPFAAGSDFPVEEVSPLLGIYAAVTRQDGAGKPDGGWYPAQKLSVQEALTGFTAGAAYAQFADTTRGRIMPGYDADLTVLKFDLEPSVELTRNQVLLTMVGGEIVYERRATN